MKSVFIALWFGCRVDNSSMFSETGNLGKGWNKGGILVASHWRHACGTLWWTCPVNT